MNVKKTRSNMCPPIADVAEASKVGKDFRREEIPEELREYLARRVFAAAAQQAAPKKEEPLISQVNLEILLIVALIASLGADSTKKVLGKFLDNNSITLLVDATQEKLVRILKGEADLDKVVEQCAKELKI